MTREIRPLATEAEFLEYCRLQLSAYPAMQNTPETLLENIRPMIEQDHTSKLWGLFSGKQMLGCMRLLDFELNYFGKSIPAGGIGSVAVDFPEKKQGVAKAILQFFIEHYQKQQAFVTLLYPFRPDFYYQMGFGYGTKMNQYSFTPASLPNAKRPHGVKYLTDEDFSLLREFSDRYADQQHGFCRRSDYELHRLLRQHAANRTLVGYKLHGKLLGYIAYNFRRENNFVKNSMLIREWLWDGQEAFLALASFLNTQADQVHRIIFNSLDPNFHFALQDVRNGTDNIIPSVYHESNLAGVGLMQRITGVADFLRQTEHRNFNGQTAALHLSVTDSFCPDNAGAYYLALEQGWLQVKEGPLPKGIELSLDITDLSSLLMGVTDISSLYRTGRLVCDSANLETLQRIFAVHQRPECITTF